MTEAAYDRIGRGYSGVRRADPRIAAQLDAALDDAHTVLNVGAGSGSYEPPTRAVTAVEPSREMISQRPPASAPVVTAVAESLPFDDGSFDAAVAVFSDHHWPQRERGLAELRRVARRRVLLLNADPALAERFWLTREYLPCFLDLIPAPYRADGYWAAELGRLLGEVELHPVPVPHDCHDGFYQAYWRRPRAYLDRELRAATSVFHRLPKAEVAAATERLRHDLESGAWEEAHAPLLECSELDLGLRLAVVELD